MERVLETHEWAVEQFGGCELGDKRRTKRAVQVATQIAKYPDGSTPNQTECWADLKATYRFFDAEGVTFTSLAEPHWQQTRQAAHGTVLLLGDTTETDFGIRRQTEGLGPTGDGRGRGFLLHNSLMVHPDTEEIIGLAGQELFYRKPAPKNENSYQRTQRPRESEVWGRVIEQIGPPAEQTRYIHVFDRGADNLEVFCRLLRQDCGWVIRAAQLHRCVRDSEGERMPVRDVLAAAPILGTYELKIRGHKKRDCRTAKLEVRCAPVTLLRPKRCTPYLKQVGFEELSQWVVEAREVDPPRGATALRWVLYTSEPVTSFEDAWRILEYYEERWLIEEFHKALKTGCRLESRQYGEASRLEAVAGMLSVVALRLLQLKRLAQQDPQRPAERVVPQRWLSMLCALRKRTIKTVHEFFRQLAGLGGHLGRKHDGEPGWITLWRGMKKLELCLRGHEAMKARCG